jgi:hypothetical protein
MSTALAGGHGTGRFAIMKWPVGQDASRYLLWEGWLDAANCGQRLAWNM